MYVVFYSTYYYMYKNNCRLNSIKGVNTNTGCEEEIPVGDATQWLAIASTWHWDTSMHVVAC